MPENHELLRQFRREEAAAMAAHMGVTAVWQRRQIKQYESEGKIPPEQERFEKWLACGAPPYAEILELAISLLGSLEI